VSDQSARAPSPGYAAPKPIKRQAAKKAISQLFLRITRLLALVFSQVPFTEIFDLDVRSRALSADLPDAIGASMRNAFARAAQMCCYADRIAACFPYAVQPRSS
jgi:hypothetical protein